MQAQCFIFVTSLQEKKLPAGGERPSNAFRKAAEAMVIIGKNFDVGVIKEREMEFFKHIPEGVGEIILFAESIK